MTARSLSASVATAPESPAAIDRQGNIWLHGGRLRNAERMMANKENRFLPDAIHDAIQRHIDKYGINAGESDERITVNGYILTSMTFFIVFLCFLIVALK
jgi:hypothetical protein